jgi:hypothetical protein
LTRVTLRGTVQAAAGYRFEWGASPAYGHASDWREVHGSAVSESVSGLAPGTTYHFRIVATRCGGCEFGTARGADATVTTRSANTVPPGGALFGAWHKDPGAPGGWSPGALLDFERMIGRKLAIDHHYANWADTFPSAPEAFDKLGGRLPMVSWDYVGMLGAILDGAHDAAFRAAADRVRAYDAPLLLRPLYEMNGNWWEGSYQGVFNNDAGLTNGPAKFVAAWRRVHDLFVERGADNAVWVWSPNCSDWPREAWNHWTNYYPGDDYVDWVSCDEYNWGTPWASFRGLFAAVPSVYGDYPQKPFMISETASCDVGGDKAAWIDDAARMIQSSFPRLGAFVWFNENVEPDCNWLVDSSPESLAAYRRMAADPYFGPPDGLPDDSVAPDPVASPTAVTAGTGAVSLAWQAASEPDAAVYRVERQAPDGSWRALANTEQPAYTDSGLVAGVRYSYRVTTVDAAGNESAPSSVVSAVADGGARPVG